MWLFIAFGIISLILFASAIFIHLSLDKKKMYKNLDGKHVVITGGSSGIGKAAAEEAARLGANVTIIGRDENKLKSAVSSILRDTQPKSDQKIQYTALDVTSDFESISKTLALLERDVGPIFMLVTCAGTCVCGQFETMKAEEIKQMIDLNYFGTAYPTKYVLPGMKERNEGIVVFVSTEAAFIGIYGYSAYSASKWAVRGLAEAINMELVGTNVRLMLAFPPDTDTPGYANEELTKPKETKLISGTAGLRTADEVGKKIINDALYGKTYSVIGATGQLMSMLCCNCIESVGQVFLQIFSMGILRLVMVFVTLSFHKIVRDGVKEKEDGEPIKAK